VSISASRINEDSTACIMQPWKATASKWIILNLFSFGHIRHDRCSFLEWWMFSTKFEYVVPIFMVRINCFRLNGECFAEWWQVWDAIFWLICKLFLGHLKLINRFSSPRF
jgi:hypothetical protein